MRLTLIAFVLLPLAVQAQNTTEPALTPQSCGEGTVWNSVTGTCMTADQHSTPLRGTPGGGNCSHSGTKQVTS